MISTAILRIWIARSLRSSVLRASYSSLGSRIAVVGFSSSVSPSVRFAGFIAIGPSVLLGATWTAGFSSSVSPSVRFAGFIAIGAVTHEAWARWYAPTSDESAPVLRGVRAESMVVQDAVWQGWATRRDVQMETAGMADTHAGDREKRRAVWIRWLQRLEANVLERVEVKLHETRHVLIDEHWGCRDVWRAFEDRLAVHEVLERYRPLCPVAFVPGGLLVEDARCTATPPASPRPRKRRRMREGSPPELQHGSDGGPSPADRDLLDEAPDGYDLLDEAPDDCFDGWAAEDALELRHEFERTVIFADGAYLPDIVARVAEELHGVVLQAMPLDANVLPLWELSRAREIVQKYAPASQFQGDAEFGGGASS
ncbi:hypothetical protein AB1Y20_013751 [Prymnesium parvum]|uniref:Uncharacterized protein n=1 Tax=Prymnesium parvum TaxID=97485 RepID=A0AB34IJI5_PRYPA